LEAVNVLGSNQRGSKESKEEEFDCKGCGFWD